MTSNTDIEKEEEEDEAVRENKINPVFGDTPLCAKGPMSMVGLEPEGYVSRRSTSREAAFCPRNKFTCCDENDFATLRPQLVRSARQINRRFEHVEEILSLFRGPQVQDFLLAVERLPNCVVLVDHPNFFSLESKHEAMEEVEVLLLNLEFYTHRTTSLSLNFLCSLCNPERTKSFKILDGRLEVSVAENVCKENLDLVDFEIRLSLFTGRFVSKLVKLASCEKNLPDAFGDVPPSTFLKSRQ